MTVEAKLRITPALDATVAGLRLLAREVRQLESGTRAADRNMRFDTMRSSLDGVSARIKSIHAQFLAFLGVQQGAQALAGLAAMSDQYQGMNARLRIVTTSQAEFNQALASGKGLAAQYNAPLNETVSLYTRILAAVRPLGGGLNEASVATEALLASLKISGATAAESASAILQFSQALGSGVLRGEEFNAINDAAPRLLDAVARGLGKQRFELKALAEQGQLTTSAVVRALQRELPQLQAEAAKLPNTISGAVQRVKDALTQLIGRELQEEARVGAAALQLLAENIGKVASALALLAGVLTAGAIGRGFAAVVAGVTRAGSVTALLTTGLSALLALIGGPVGLTVALVALAAAWVGLGAAKASVRDRNAEAIQRERDAVVAEINDLNNNGGFNYLQNITNAKRRLRALEAELAKATGVEDEARANAQQSARENRRFASNSTLLDPAGVKKFEDEYKTRSSIVKKYADERAAYVIAKDKEIAAATARNDPAEAKRLAGEKMASLAVQAKEQKEALRKFDTEGAATRLAQAKVLYDQDFELLADATQRQRKLLQERFDQGLVDLQSYLAERGRLQDAEANQEADRLVQQLVEEKRVLEINRERLKVARDANARETTQESITASLQKIAELDTEITKRERDRLDNARQLADEARRYTQELAQQRREIEAQIKQALGTETPGDIARRVQDQFAGQVQREFQLGGDGSATQRLVDITVLQEVLKQLETNFKQSLAEIRLAEDAFRTQQEQGAISIEEAERRILEVRKAQVPALQQQAGEIGRIAESLGRDEQLRAREAAGTVQQLSDTRTELDKQAREAGRTGFGQLFSDILSGARQADSALQNMLNNFRQRMANLIGERLGNKLFESFGLGKLIDSGVSLLTSVFGFHSGGLVSAGGATFTRSMAVSPMAVALAPRYHTGGIVGLKPRERLAVLEDGEEVLSQDSPRHARNYRNSSGVSISSSVTVNAASGDASTAQRAGEGLQAAIDATVDAWAMRESRPGGILYKG